jgi:hypothetical protein
LPLPLLLLLARPEPCLPSNGSKGSHGKVARLYVTSSRTLMGYSSAPKSSGESE